MKLNTDSNGDLDDLFVPGLESLHLERMDDQEWCLIGYLANGDRITLSIFYQKKEVKVIVVEYPKDSSHGH